MNSKNILPIKNECTCMKCLKEFKDKDLIDIEIPELGYGSDFDGINTKLILCKDCFEKSNPQIWNLKVKQQWASEFPDYQNIENDFVICQEYEHEKEMLEYIEDLPLQSKELVWNTFSSGWLSDYKLNSQDWIDFELDELPHEKCKEYGLISPEEIKAYKTRFPSCEWVYNQIYSDNSHCSKCPYHAFGKFGQIPNVQVSQECYGCQLYKPRETELKTINEKEEEKYREKLLMRIYKERLNEEIF